MQRARCGIAAAVVLAALGCGGGDGVPAPSPVPASLTVLTGNAQSARYGTAVAVAPAVMLRDAEGAAIAGLDVTFSVIAGNGAVTGATARTSTTGVATAGSWTLGPVPGANVLRATIGTLGATITATGTVEPEEAIDVGAQVAGQIVEFGKDKNGKEVDYGAAVEIGRASCRERV